MAVTADEFEVRERFFPRLARVLARVPLAFRHGEVDAAMTDLGQDLSDQG